MSTLEAATGITRPMISHYETGSRRMPYSVLCQLVRAMGLRLCAVQHAQTFDLGLGDVEIEVPE